MNDTGVKTIPRWAIALGLLLLAYCLWYSFAWYTRWQRNSYARAFAANLKVVAFYTSDGEGVEIIDKITRKPIWRESDFNHDGKPDEQSFFFRGTNVFNLYLRDAQSPEYAVLFQGTGKRETWLDKGSGSFVEKIVDDANNVASRVQVWYNEAWYTIENRNGRRVVFVNGLWLRLNFTNGLWAPETPTVESTTSR